MKVRLFAGTTLFVEPQPCGSPKLYHKVGEALRLRPPGCTPGLEDPSDAASGFTQWHGSDPVDSLPFIPLQTDVKPYRLSP